jgi:hypothetical protein
MSRKTARILQALLIVALVAAVVIHRSRLWGGPALHRLKNRSTAPQPSEFNPAITMAALVAPGDDTNRWRNNEGAEITGYVWDVKDEADHDTHIELVPNPQHPEQKVIVEVTPRWRSIMAQQGVDWSSAALRDTLHGRWVRVRGWMLFDADSKDESENTAPGHGGNWRWTAWEVHPITSIELVPTP